VEKVVDAIAIDRSGCRLAIEHTVVQPFFGEKDDTRALCEVFLQLGADPRFRVPGYGIDVCVPVGLIRRGRKFRWGEMREAVNVWFLENAPSFPAGHSSQRILGLPLDPTVSIFKESHPEGRVFVFRSGMPETFMDVIRKAVRDKIPKLLATPADRRVLLLEKDNIPRGYAEAARHLDIAMAISEAPDEVWIVNTAGWEMGGDLWFMRIWPGGVSARFRMRAPAGHAELAELVRAA